MQLGVPNPSSDSVQQYEQWFQQAELACGRIERALFESLHELFGLDQIDAFAAKTAYERLLGTPDHSVSETRLEKVAKP